MKQVLIAIGIESLFAFLSITFGLDFIKLNITQMLIFIYQYHIQKNTRKSSGKCPKGTERRVV